MKFLLTRATRYRPIREAEYTVQPAVILVDPVTHMRAGGQKRIYARFTGTPPSFDSLEAQRQNGWTDEERLRVERHLLTHKDWGVGLHLFPGEQMPPEHEGLGVQTTAGSTPAPRPVQMVEGLCKFLVAEFPPEVCGAEALAGSDFCEEHFAKVKVAEAKPKGKAKVEVA